MTRTPPQDFSEAIASEVRAEMGRQSKSKADLARALGMTPHTAASRLSARTRFDSVELLQVAAWLGVRPSQFWPEADEVSA